MYPNLMRYLAVVLVGVAGGCSDMKTDLYNGLNDDESLDRRLNGGFYKDGNLPETHYNRIVWTPVSHRIAFTPNSAQINREQANQIDQFLYRVSAKRGEQIAIVAGAGEDANPGLPQRRIAAVRQYVAARGYVAANVAVVPGGDDANAATISVNRNAAVVPNCPSWDAVMSGQDTSAMRRHFGCLTAQSLGNQVDNLNDLLRGRVLGKGDGQALAKGVQDYRAGTPGGVNTQSPSAPSTTPGTAAK